MGVPRVALGWGACDPNNPKNRRRRCSLLVERWRRRRHARPGRLLAGPARAAARRRGRWLDGVLLTPRACRPHPRHRRPARRCSCTAPPAARHLYGRADRRASCAPDSAIASPAPPGSDYPPIAAEHRAERRPSRSRSSGQGGPIEALPVLQEHGDIPSLGFRFGEVAYSCDIKRLPAESLAAMAGPRRLDRRCAALAPHPSHMNLDEALDWIERIKPQARDPDQSARRPRLRGIARANCRPNVEPAYDGMRIAVD